MTSHSCLARRNIYRNVRTVELIKGKSALALKFHLATNDSGSPKLEMAILEVPAFNVPV